MRPALEHGALELESRKIQNKVGFSLWSKHAHAAIIAWHFCQRSAILLALSHVFSKFLLYYHSIFSRLCVQKVILHYFDILIYYRLQFTTFFYFTGFCMYRTFSAYEFVCFLCDRYWLGKILVLSELLKYSDDICNSKLEKWVTSFVNGLLRKTSLKWFYLYNKIRLYKFIWDKNYFTIWLS